ncbi:hypothetical protein ICN28_08730 [Polynucleobacter sp. 30F-ANTBAC]|jgi:hypothetical protein|uniref:hypothetical protein n=1 Tax=Polynucleobacter sp. 30F-ANTBAC TaxID=2689095 RepID=UPI001C0B0331|nr:hypothetical protein [Polynucleobacter sp. 30F-ANTBAC]MBU3600602.1 hypothetical protein [Polynucleobacter sp. 30F-ANTBAC]
MTIKFIKPIAIVTSMFAVFAMLSTPAYAQKGRRACGVVGEVNGVAVMAILQDRNKDENGKICNKIIDEMSDKLKKNPQTASLQLKRIHKDSCESVGSMFKSANWNEQTKDNSSVTPPTYSNFPDICDLMKAEDTYQVSRAPNDKKMPIFSITKVN